MDEQESSEREGFQIGGSSRLVGICKLVHKKQSFEKAKAKAASMKAGQIEEKELQLTWGVTLNDLEHKLKRAGKTLEKGGRVALIFSAPRDSKVPSRPEREMFVGMCKQQLGQKAGKLAVWKPEEWIGSRTAVFLQGVKDELQGIENNNTR